MFWTRSLRLFRSSRVFSSHYHSRKFCSFSQDNDLGSWESMEGLSRCSANFVPLSPITFLERAAKVCRDRTSLVYGSLQYNWGQTHQRCLKLASALTLLGISRGDVLSDITTLCMLLELSSALQCSHVSTNCAALLTILICNDETCDAREQIYGSVFALPEVNESLMLFHVVTTQVGTLLPNVPAMYELHFAVPMAGAILCTLNSRLDAAMVSVLLEHSQAKVLFVDYQLLEVARGALDLLGKKATELPILVLVTDSDCPSTFDITSVSYEYERLLADGHDGFDIVRPRSELDPVSINYTSGTTSRPKGVVYSHRGAYLNSLATVLLFRMDLFPVYLWNVPMFHCNGWCLPWGVASQFGINICVRKVSPKNIFDNIARHKVTHMAGAPTVLNMIVNSALTDRKQLNQKVVVMTGGSPPPPQILDKMEEIGFSISHLYGLTETYGPGTFCAWRPEWDLLPHEDRSKMKARQGVPHVALEEIDVKDPASMESVPSDGKTMGEVMFRGNTVMSGYFRDLKATEEAFRDGWFRSGDLAVKHSDGYIEVKDRLKDIIISGGENISSVEVETVLYSHPAILEAAVVARPDDHWGQTPCAFVKLKEGFDVNAQDIINFSRDHLPHYMAPKTVVFQDIPKTSTGKIQKYVLREKAEALGSLSRPHGCDKL